MKPTVSIITVCFNSGPTIEETIRSVISQDYSPLEYIIIDGASNDNTLEIIKKYQDRINIIVQEPDDGMYDAMNKGIGLAQGEIVGLLNADDIFAHKSVLSEIMKVFDNNEIQACYGDLIYFSQHHPDKICRYWQSNVFIPGLFAKGWCPPHPTFFVRRHLYAELGGFDLTYSMGNDVELMMRFLEKNRIKSQYIPQVLVKMRLGGASNKKVKNIIEQNKNILLAAKNLKISISPITFYFYKLLNRVSQFILKPKGEHRYAK